MDPSRDEAGTGGGRRAESADDPSPSRRRTRPTLEETRERLLVAGEELVLEQTAARSTLMLGALAHVSVADVAQRAGLTKGMIYHIWSSQDAYRSELLERLATTSTTDSFVANVDLAGLEFPETFDAAVDLLTQLTFEMAMQEHRLYLFLEIHSYAGNPAVRSALRAGQDVALERTVQLFELMLDHYGLELVDGFSTQDLVLLVRAFGRGVTLQEALSPGTMQVRRALPGSGGSAPLMSVGMKVLAAGLVRPAGASER